MALIRIHRTIKCSPSLNQLLNIRLFCVKEENTDKKPTKKKSLPIPKITLLSGSTLTVTTLEEAQKLSQRRDLKLVKINELDPKNQRPVYKLISGTEYYQEDLKNREERKKQKSNSFIKGEKILMMSDKISEHDLEVQAKKILKWLTKSFQVNVVVNGNIENMEKCNKVYNFLATFVGENGRFLQKRTKGSDLKFQIVPPKKDNVQEQQQL